MYRILFIAGLICMSTALAVAQDDSVERYRTYFKNLGLSYVEARGCSADAPCSITGDFNGDGVTDLAALYEYSGDTNRRAGWNLDLVILYSQPDSGEPAHAVFTHVGQVDARTGATAFLAVQGRGLMKIPAGEISLELPGINIVAAGATYAEFTNGSAFPTFYWRDDSFHAIDKSND